MFGRTIRFPKRLPLFSAVQYLISGKLCAINICGPFLRNDAKCAGTSEDHDIQSEFPSRRTASSATPIGVSGHRFSLQNKCELGDSLSVTSFAHLGERKWAASVFLHVHNMFFHVFRFENSGHFHRFVAVHLRRCTVRQYALHQGR